MASAQSTSQTFKRFLNKGTADDQYLKYPPETDIAKIEACFSFAEQLYPSHALILCNRSHPKLTYVSKNCHKLLGLTAESFRALSVQDFFNLVHPADLGALTRCFDFVSEIKVYQPIAHRFVFYYRVKHQSGDYIHIRDEKLAIPTANDRYMYFAILKDVTRKNKFFNVKVEVQEYSDDGLQQDIYSFNPMQGDSAITPRQNDIIQLMGKGLSVKEIAHSLNLSVNTVKNHKQALFRKVNVKSTVELINVVREFALKGA